MNLKQDLIMTDHNGFKVDEVPPRLSELPPVSAYASKPARITGIDPKTGKTITVIARRIASGPDGKPYTFAEDPKRPMGASTRLMRNKNRIEELEEYGDDLSATYEAAVIRVNETR